LNRSQLVEEIASTAGLARRQADEAVDAFVNVVAAQVRSGNKVTIYGFGSFNPTSRKARTGRNPRTGQPVKIAASKGIRFSPATGFKAELNAKKAAAKKAAPAKAVKAPAAKAVRATTVKAAKVAAAKAPARKVVAKAAKAAPVARAASRPVKKVAAPAVKAAVAKAPAKKAVAAKAAPAKKAPAKTVTKAAKAVKGTSKSPRAAKK